MSTLLLKQHNKVYFPHANFHFVFIVSGLYFEEPIHTIVFYHNVSLGLLFLGFFLVLEEYVKVNHLTHLNSCAICELRYYEFFEFYFKSHYIFVFS